MTISMLGALRLDARWTEQRRDGRSVRLRYNDEDGDIVEFAARRCAEGRLRDTYPVGTNDVELDADCVAPQKITWPLAALALMILRSDAHCRRVVFAAAVGDQAMVAAVQAAGFRYVLDVDVPGAELSLLVAEPGWVTELDDDRVPGS